MRFDIMECGIRIRAMREDLHYTQMQFADQLNISLDHLKSIERGRRAEIGHQRRPSVHVVGAGAVGQTIRPQRLRVVDADVHPRLDPGADHHGVDIQELDDAGTEGMHHLRHHGGHDHVIHILRRVPAHPQELGDHQTILVRGVIRFRGDPVRAHDPLPLKETEHDIRIADVHCK